MFVITNNSEETIKLGRKISKFLRQGDVVALFGNLGAGKSTLVKGIARGLGVKEETVCSPSFVLLKAYKTKPPLYHFDFYRIKKLEESYSSGLEEFLFTKGICVIEWADRIKKLLPKEYLRIELKFEDTDKRKIHLNGFGAHYRNLLKKL